MSRALAVAALLLAAACGREIHHTVDAPPGDVASDSSIPDNGEPPADAVSLTLTRRGVVIGGATILFQAPDSTLITTATSDINGRAWARMPSGGFVTAVEHVGAGLDELTTFATVVNGDALRLDLEPLGDVSVTTLTLGVPLDTSGADGYRVRTPCGELGLDATGSAEITLTGCGATADLVVESLVDGTPTGRALYAPAVGLAAAGPVQLAGTYEPLATHTLTYSNVPAAVTSIAAYQALSAARRSYEIADVAVPAGGTATLQLSVPAATASLLTVANLYPASGEIGQQSLYDWDTAASAYSADLATALLPAYATAPAYDLAAHTVTWTERAGGTRADLVRVELDVHRDDIPAGRAWHWRLAVARDTSASVTFPTLPATDFDFNPGATDTIVIADLTNTRLPGGLAPWRTTIFGPTSQAILGAAGRIAVQTLSTPEL